ncbi:hypothetical protein C8R43DRAFT_944820 [Mycena crocata]|nr:hypothetical protein C8R43DRAFT_944820 [Mycena crocata]
MALFNGQVPEKFEEAFDAEFVRGTYYSHHNQWKAMKDHSLLAAAIKCGRADGGEWATLLRISFEKKRNKECLNPSPPFYEEAITQIVEEQIAVNWDWVANPQGEGDRVSEKVCQFVDERLIVLPEHNHLTIQPRPQPSLLTRHSTWGGTKEEYDEERNYLFWKLVSHVLNHLGNDEHEFFAKRFHQPELNEAVRYLGRRKERVEDEPAGTVTNKLELQELDLTCHVSVSVRTRKLIEKVILFGRTIMPGEAPGYYVYWTLPGVNAGEKWGPLYIYNPEDSDEGQWGPGIDGKHCIPALGPYNALRIMLTVEPLPLSQYLSEEERITVLFVQHLQRMHGHDHKIEEICSIFHSKDHAKRNAGRTPAQWTSWLPSIAAIMEDKEVLEDASETDIAGKKITQAHVAAFLRCRSNCVSSALKAHAIIGGRNRNLPGMNDYLTINDAKKTVGIDAFLKKPIVNNQLESAIVPNSQQNVDIFTTFWNKIQRCPTSVTTNDLISSVTCRDFVIAWLLPSATVINTNCQDMDSTTSVMLESHAYDTVQDLQKFHHSHSSLLEDGQITHASQWPRHALVRITPNFNLLGRFRLWVLSCDGAMHCQDGTSWTLLLLVSLYYPFFNEMALKLCLNPHLAFPHN